MELHVVGALLSPYGYNRQAYIRIVSTNVIIELQNIYVYYGYNNGGVRLEVTTLTRQY